MTDGSSGSDSRAFMCADGSRATVLALSSPPSSGAEGDAGLPPSATTVVVSAARAMSSMMRAASARRPRLFEPVERHSDARRPATLGVDDESPVGFRR